MEPDGTISDPLGNPGEPVAAVDPEDLKSFWQRTRDLQAAYPDQSVGVTFEAVGSMCVPGANPAAVWYRSAMIFGLQRVAPEQLAPWVKDEEVSDAVFRVMGTIPMEWIGHTDREGFPFDIEEFFLRLEQT